jgi:hypothetical protein
MNKEIMAARYAHIVWLKQDRRRIERELGEHPEAADRYQCDLEAIDQCILRLEEPPREEIDLIGEIIELQVKSQEPQQEIKDHGC